MISKKSGFDSMMERSKREREIQNQASATVDRFLSELNETTPEEDTRALQMLCGIAIMKIIAKGDKYRATDFLYGVLGIAMSTEFPEPIRKSHPMELM